MRIGLNLEDRGSGALEYKFNADGFEPPPKCDPERKPTFDLEDVTPEGQGGSNR
ncbi:MAG: hypothetical protein ABEN55_16370 [Bradymonadaceae bacterium]